MNRPTWSLVLVAALLISGATPQAHAAEPAGYEPAPENLAAREWFQDAGFGIFIHWGVYSVLGNGEWVMHKSKMTVDEYKPLADQFNPTKYDPAEWVALFKRAGARYVTITSKHHDGFAMWDSPSTDWDIVDATPYGRDVLKPLADECKKQGLKLFFYHSHLDWTHPDYFPRGRTGGFSERPEEGDFSRYLDFMDGQLTELLDGRYGDVAGIWFDGWWDQRQGKPGSGKAKLDWRLDQTYGLIHRLQPACLIGNNHHEAPFPGEDFQMFERDLPGQNKAGLSKGSKIGSLPLETCDTINKSWGYRASDKAFKSKRELVHYLVRAAGRNANLLLNVGPKPDGTIQPQMATRLEQMGEWLATNGETIYGTRVGPVKAQAWGVSTKAGETIFLHVLDPPKADAQGWTTLAGAGMLSNATIREFSTGDPLEVRSGDTGELAIKLPASAAGAIDTILVINPNE